MASTSETVLGPRIVYLNRGERGFGFKLRGQTEQGGEVRAVHGELYAPMQFISGIEPGQSADRAGLKINDRLLEVNGVSIEGSPHREVVDLVKASPDRLALTVITLSPEDVESLYPTNEVVEQDSLDYNELRPYPVTIPDYAIVNSLGQRYTIYNIHLGGRKIGARRYSEFVTLHNNLRKQFKGYKFPKFPGRWPFHLTDYQLESRRRGLEKYLFAVVAVNVIAESDFIEDFFRGAPNVSPEAEIQIWLPDSSIFKITVEKTLVAQMLWDALVSKAKLSPNTKNYFYLFEIAELKFERKLQPHEIPYKVYIENQGKARVTCLCVGRWLFTVNRELTLPDDDQAVRYLYNAATEEVNRGNIRPGDKRLDLISLQMEGKFFRYLALARCLPGYGDIYFPHCKCSSRRHGNVVPAVGINSFRLYACNDDGTFQGKVVELTWDSITRYGSVEATSSFDLRYCVPNEPSLCIQIKTRYHVFLADCFDRIMEERNWYDDTPV